MIRRVDCDRLQDDAPDEAQVCSTEFNAAVASAVNVYIAVNGWPIAINFHNINFAQDVSPV
jgi:hypothetical protein